jgi:hypothetical protein
VEFVPFVAIFISQNLAEKARELAIAITEMFFRFLRALFPVAYLKCVKLKPGRDSAASGFLIPNTTHETRRL